jgi:hypothetical protein
MVLGAFVPAYAQPESRELGKFGAWEAFVDVQGGQPICYMATKPTKSEGTYTARGDVLLTVTHRPAQKTFDTVSIVAGYQYKVDSEIAVRVGKDVWNFFSSGDRAWARDAATDKAVAHAIVQGSSLVAKGTSIRGTPTTDTFTLSGSAKAYQAIGDACRKSAK